MTTVHLSGWCVRALDRQNAMTLLGLINLLLHALYVLQRIPPRVS